MTIELNLPSPRSVQSTAIGEQTFRLLTLDGTLLARLDPADASASFPGAFMAFVMMGNTRVALHDIPEPLRKDTVNALRAAGWHTKVQYFADPDLIVCVAAPYTPVAYNTVAYLCWSAQPFPLAFEEKLWRWIKSWFV